MKKILIAVLIILLNVNLLQGAIDVGAPCIDRSDGFGDNYTFVEKSNPANATGTIDHIDVWMYVGGTTQFASFYVVSGSNLSTRGNTGNITTVTGDNNFNAPGDFTTFNINEGDYIGVYAPAGIYIMADWTGGIGYWYKSGDRIPCTNLIFISETDYILSLYATGTESGGPPAPQIQSQILILE